MLEGVPGIPIKVSDMNPPETPPIHTLIRIAMPILDDMLKVIGRSSVTPIVPESPGKAPNTIPMALHRIMKNKVSGCSID